MFHAKFFICFSTLYLMGANGQITCPACSDPHDPSSCTLTQHCHNHDTCELHVHLADNNRVEYICHNSHACVNQETHPCSALTHETCTFCCNSIQACQAERENLFTNRFTPAPTQGPTQGPTQVPTTINPPRINNCIRCDTTPCDEMAVPNLRPVQCPLTEPYCYTEVVQTGANRSVSRGCASANFCRSKWWDYSSVATLCRYPYFSSTQDLDCTFCCEGDGCNSNERPPEYSLVIF